MQSDNIKLWFTYLTMLVVIVGGLGFLMATRLDPPNTSQGLQLLVAGFIGSAITFVTTREVQTQTARSTSAAFAAGAIVSNTTPPPGG